MHRPRCLIASGSLGGIAIVVGGTDMNGNILASTELYDSSLGRWEMLPNMHSPRRLCSGFFMDGKFYVMEVCRALLYRLFIERSFDLETKKWKKIEGIYLNVNRAPQAPPLVVVINNELFTLEYLSNIYGKELR